MSYQFKGADAQVVVCDICGDFSWVGDRHWREMPQSGDAKCIHLCHACRPVAQWCDAHQRYHLPSDMHRRACVDCGGLFTSVVRNAITRCPSCLRAAGLAVPPPQPAPARPASIMRLLFSPRSGRR